MIYVRTAEIPLESKAARLPTLVAELRTDPGLAICLSADGALQGARLDTDLEGTGEENVTTLFLVFTNLLICLRALSPLPSTSLRGSTIFPAGASHIRAKVFVTIVWPWKWILVATLVALMAAAQPVGGIPLTECRKDVPPGWSPGNPDYPLRLFFEKLKLWYRIYDGPDESVGPLVAGRLGGRAQKIALSLRLPRPDGQTDVGDAALVRLSVDEVRDPANPMVILQNHVPSDIQALATALREAFGQSDQELTTQALEQFFELRRGKLDGNYSYWVEDPIMIGIIRGILKKVMYVKGAHVTLHPWAKVFPEPHFPAEQAPMRLMIVGEYKKWVMMPLEDLRELSPAQQRQKMDEENWMITFFGTRQEEEAAPALAPASVPVQPAPQQPPQEAQEPQAQPAPYEGVDMRAINARPIKPLYSVKRVLQRLPQAAKDERTANKLLLGLHEKLWRATASDFANLLMRAGMPPEMVQLASEAVAVCEVCRKYSRLPARPKTKVSLAAHFNDETEMDIFYLWEKKFVLMVDVATRDKIAFETPSREAGDLLKGILQHWIRHFGPMRVLTLDQESSLLSHEAAADLERIGVTRNPKGATSGESTPALGWWNAMWDSPSSPC